MGGDYRTPAQRRALDDAQEWVDRNGPFEPMFGSAEAAEPFLPSDEDGSQK
jgi:hypothetical protein